MLHREKAEDGEVTIMAKFPFIYSPTQCHLLLWSNHDDDGYNVKPLSQFITTPWSSAFVTATLCTDTIINYLPQLW